MLKLKKVVRAEPASFVVNCVQESSGSKQCNANLESHKESAVTYG